MYRTVPFAFLVACGAREAPAPAPTAPAAATAHAPEEGDEALCGIIGTGDAAAQAGAAAKLAGRFPPDPAADLVVLARHWCLGAWERPYMYPDGCIGERTSACDVDACATWQQAHGAPEEMAVEQCMQDCNCGE
jgi:hypothetical protein